MIALDSHIVKTISSADDKISSEEHVTRSLAAIAEMGKAKAM